MLLREHNAAPQVSVSGGSRRSRERVRVRADRRCELLQPRRVLLQEGKMQILESALITTVFLAGILIANHVSGVRHQIQTSATASCGMEAGPDKQ